MIALTFILLMAAVLMFLGAAGLLLWDGYSVLRNRQRARNAVRDFRVAAALMLMAWSPVIGTVGLFRL